MSNAQILAIDRLINDYTAQIVADTIKMVNIKSVQSEPLPGAPFGTGPKEMLTTFMHMAREAGLYCTDYGVGVISAALQKDTPDLGIWLHGDVVPEGDGWRFSPYDATEYEGCVIGRGATDNKGQLAAIFNLFKIFKELGIQLKYNPAIYLGSNEESGMRDMIGVAGNPDAKGFINVCTPPRLSLVPDGGFPIGYGGKGGMNITIRSKTALHGFTLTAGQDASPGLARAVFDTCNVPDALSECTVTKGTHTEISAFSPPRHLTRPDPNGNMITKLSAALLDADVVPKEDRYILEFFKAISLDIHGALFGIDTHHEVMGPLTVFAKQIDCVDGYPEITLNIRYPLGITYQEIIERISCYAERVGFLVVFAESRIEPYMLDPNSPLVCTLGKIANEITGDDKKPYTLSGGTYAHRLPNAYVYGMNGNLRPKDFPEGRGGAHGIDEVVSIDRLKRAMRIYARALLCLNDMEW